MSVLVTNARLALQRKEMVQPSLPVSLTYCSVPHYQAGLGKATTYPTGITYKTDN